MTTTAPQVSRPWVGTVARFEQRPLIALPLALGLVALALAARLAIDPWMPTGYPFVTFFPVVVIVSFLCGWRYGALAAVVSGLVSWYAFIPPVGSLSLADGVLTALASFAVVTATEVGLIWALEHAVSQSRAAEQTSRDLARHATAVP